MFLEEPNKKSYIRVVYTRLKQFIPKRYISFHQELDSCAKKMLQNDPYATTSPGKDEFYNIIKKYVNIDMPIEIENIHKWPEKVAYCYHHSHTLFSASEENIHNYLPMLDKLLDNQSPTRLYANKYIENMDVYCNDRAKQKYDYMLEDIIILNKDLLNIYYYDNILGGWSVDPYIFFGIYNQCNCELCNYIRPFSFLNKKYKKCGECGKIVNESAIIY
jgi:hypothetical protein